MNPSEFQSWSAYMREHAFTHPTDAQVADAEVLFGYCEEEERDLKRVFAIMARDAARKRVARRLTRQIARWHSKHK